MFAYCGNNPINNYDPSGQLFISALIVGGLVLSGVLLLSSCSAKPDSNASSSPRTDLANAPNLNVDTAPSNTYNCYGNGIAKQINTNPTGYTAGDSTRKTFEAVKKDIGSNNVRELSSINDIIGIDEFKVAMKCGPTDYHFIRLTEKGWYNKSGGYYQGLYINESKVMQDTWMGMAIINGQYYEGAPFYTDETIYFAVKKEWDRQ